MSYIFTTVPNDQMSPARGLANKLVPAGQLGGDINVIKNFSWSYSPKTKEVLDQVPYIKLKEYYLLDNTLNQIFKAYGLVVNNVGDVTETAVTNFGAINVNDNRVYQGLYDLDHKTGFTYTLPFFNSTYLNTTNSWTAAPMFEEIVKLQKLATAGAYVATAGAGLAGLGVVAGAATLATGGGFAALLAAAGAVITPYAVPAAKAALRVAEAKVEIEKQIGLMQIGAYSGIGRDNDPAIDKPKIWNNTLPRTYTITFPLFNTIGDSNSKDGWSEQIVKNWELCYLLCYQNLYNKRNLFTGLPPVFYSIDIPGVHYTKAGYVSNLTILNAGNIRNMSLPVGPGNVNVPDAYIVNMTITDFFTPSKNFLSTIGSSEKGTLVQSFEGGDTLTEPEPELPPTVPVPPVITPVGPVFPASIP